MGGRGASSRSSKAANSYGVHVRRNQSLKEITDGAHKTFSGMSRDNLRANLNANIYPSLSKAGRRLATTQHNKRVFERSLADAKKRGDKRNIDFWTKQLEEVEYWRQTELINVQNLKAVRDVARGYYAKYK